ncbi:Protein RCC2 [Seminavis robusta]|uniref:Protein RCC2 n=1 Tax=Seminavis robusta TaxID=568900 RepID=A0A9N8HKJ7_9STRA|nr:Protein RCC2 [Seminavis robusta]|eukprot:Sro621_g176630.1 Protein RCC2 (274) ;mRNA; f:657-1478
MKKLQRSFLEAPNALHEPNKPTLQPPDSAMKPFIFSAKPNDGAKHFLGITSRGEALSWGKNNLGQLGRDTGGSNSKEPKPVECESNETTIHFVKAYVGGCSESGHSALLDSKGFLWLAGCDRWQQLGLGSSAGGSSGYTWNQGRVWRNKFVRNEFLASKMEGSIRDVSLGGDHTIVLSSNQRDVYVFGKGGDGQLGLDGKPFVSAPTRSKTLSSSGTKIAAVCAMKHCSLTLDDQGKTLAKTGRCSHVVQSLEQCIRRAASQRLLNRDNKAAS